MIYVGLNVALASYAVFAPTIIRDLGFSALNAQLLSIPPYGAACVLVFVSTSFIIAKVPWLMITGKVGILEFGSHSAAWISYYGRIMFGNHWIHFPFGNS